MRVTVLWPTGKAKSEWDEVGASGGAGWDEAEKDAIGGDWSGESFLKFGPIVLSLPSDMPTSVDETFKAVRPPREGVVEAVITRTMRFCCPWLAINAFLLACVLRHNVQHSINQSLDLVSHKQPYNRMKIVVPSIMVCFLLCHGNYTSSFQPTTCGNHMEIMWLVITCIVMSHK